MINLRMQPAEAKKLSPRITVVGVGGAGGNAVNNMINTGLEGVEFLVCNTDAQALESSLAANKLHLGTGVTGGLGAGGRPDIGRAAAEESLDDLQRYIEGSNMVFITCGMGGGTGTGAAPVIAKACRDAGVLTVGVVTKPFQFEGSSRARAAEQGIEEIQEYVDTLIVIPNQNLFRVANEKTTFAEAFKMADSVLQAGVRGITDLIMMPGLINLDFADIRSIMTEMGKAVMGTGEASGEKRAMDAAEKAISNPLLDDVSMKGARGVIINVTGGYDMTLYEVDEACNRIRDEVDPEAAIIFGSTFDESLEGQMRVSIVATGIDKVAASAGGSNYGSKPLERPSRPKYELPSTVRPAYAAPARPLASAPVAPQAAAPVAPVEATAQADIFTAASSAAAPQANNYGGGHAALRGSVQGGSFIPPAPMQAEPQAVQQPAYAQRQAAAPQPQYQAPAAQAPAYVQPQMEVAPVEQPKAPLGLYAAADQQPQEQRAAPVVPQQGQQQRGKASFFERLTGSSWKGREGVEERADSFDEPRAAATPAKPATQGSLNIDSPVKPIAPNFEDELDIPAFLRRQAN